MSAKCLRIKAGRRIRCGALSASDSSVEPETQMPEWDEDDIGEMIAHEEKHGHLGTPVARGEPADAEEVLVCGWESLAGSVCLLQPDHDGEHRYSFPRDGSERLLIEKDATIAELLRHVARLRERLSMYEEAQQVKR
jgi:hypothetical protein